LNRDCTEELNVYGLLCARSERKFILKFHFISVVACWHHPRSTSCF